MPEPLPVVTLIVVGITVVVSLRGFASEEFLDQCLFDTERILLGRQWYRLFSSALVHLDIPHLFFNMFALYSFGRLIELVHYPSGEIVYGPLVLLAIYIAAILGGDLLSLFLHRRQSYRALGASGGVCGIIYATIFLCPGGGIGIIFLPFYIPDWLFAILYMAYSLYGMKSRLGNIGHDAHIGGAIVGLLTATAMYPRIVGERPALYAAIMAISVGLFIVLLLPWRRLGMGARQGGRARRDPGAEKLEHHRRQDARVDAILDKIAKSGMDSLTPEERDELFRISAAQKGDKRE
jgi:membrane associated rhomboid family serine protease